MFRYYDKIASNEINIKKIMGLETKKSYKDVKPLRYGKIMIRWSRCGWKSYYSFI